MNHLIAFVVLYIVALMYIFLVKGGFTADLVGVIATATALAIGAMMVGSVILWLAQWILKMSNSFLIWVAMAFGGAVSFTFYEVAWEKVSHLVMF